MKLVPKNNLAATVYEQIKRDIFDFRLLPGDRFTETEVAERVGVSRTPVREALYKLEREGYIQVSSRNGWSVTHQAVPCDGAASTPSEPSGLYWNAVAE